MNIFDVCLLVLQIPARAGIFASIFIKWWVKEGDEDYYSGLINICTKGNGCNRRPNILEFKGNGT